MLLSNGRWKLVSQDSGSSTCGNPLPYICKKNREEKPQKPEIPQGEGTCDNDWAYEAGSSCYYIEVRVF